MQITVFVMNGANMMPVIRQGHLNKEEVLMQAKELIGDDCYPKLALSWLKGGAFVVVGSNDEDAKPIKIDEDDWEGETFEPEDLGDASVAAYHTAVRETLWRNNNNPKEKS